MDIWNIKFFCGWIFVWCVLFVHFFNQTLFFIISLYHRLCTSIWFFIFCCASGSVCVCYAFPFSLFIEFIPHFTTNYFIRNGKNQKFQRLCIHFYYSFVCILATINSLSFHHTFELSINVLNRVYLSLQMSALAVQMSIFIEYRFCIVAAEFTFIEILTYVFLELNE